MGGKGLRLAPQPPTLFKAHFLAALLLWLSWGDHQLPEPLAVWTAQLWSPAPRGAHQGALPGTIQTLNSSAPLLWTRWGRWRVSNRGYGLVCRMWPEKIQRFWAVWAIFV